MKSVKGFIFIFTLCMCVPAFSQSQQQSLPQGVVVYALPMTSVQIQAEAVREVFTAGPYAKFAGKYLGIEVATENKETYSFKSINLTPYVEADAAQTYTVALKSNKSAANFLSMTATGLVALFEDNAHTAIPWRFAHEARESDFHDRGPVSNLAKETTTFYQTVKTNAGFDRVPVQQSQLVEKNVERRAEETANMIYALRKRRIELITGDADNAPNAAVFEEITRLENEYMSLFVGKSESYTQAMTFDVVPDHAQAKQLYVAFRFSDTQGLLSPANLAGRPIVLELTPEKDMRAMPSNDSDADTKGKRVSYRIPAVVQARLTDGQTTLLQTRFPVYQLGRVMTFAIDAR
jgi:hypothetical protein